MIQSIELINWRIQDTSRDINSLCLISFICIQFSKKIVKTIGWRPHLNKSWIRHCVLYSWYEVDTKVAKDNSINSWQNTPGTRKWAASKLQFLLLHWFLTGSGGRNGYHGSRWDSTFHPDFNIEHLNNSGNSTKTSGIGHL